MNDAVGCFGLSSWVWTGFVGWGGIISEMTFVKGRDFWRLVCLLCKAFQGFHTTQGSGLGAASSGIAQVHRDGHKTSGAGKPAKVRFDKKLGGPVTHPA